MFGGNLGGMAISPRRQRKQSHFIITTGGKVETFTTPISQRNKLRLNEVRWFAWLAPQALHKVFFFPELGYPRRGAMCRRKSGLRMELDPKKAQKAHLAGGQRGTWEGCSGPCRREQVPPGNGGQDQGWHTCIPYLGDSLHPLDQCAENYTHPSPKRITCMMFILSIGLPCHCVASSLSFPSEHLHVG